jgi:dihydroneopterin aldolase
MSSNRAANLSAGQPASIERFRMSIRSGRMFREDIRGQAFVLDLDLEPPFSISLRSPMNAMVSDYGFHHEHLKALAETEERRPDPHWSDPARRLGVRT